MVDYRKLSQAIVADLRSSLQHQQIRVGWLGKITATDTVNPNPMDGLDLPYIWVRFEENGEAVRAVNMRVDSRMANVRVRVGRDRATGELEVLGLATEAAQELGEIAGTLNTPSRISDLITELVDPLRIKPLRVRPGDNAFDVYVEGGYYWHNGELKGWTGDFINIAGSVPSGINTKRPVLIGIDPATDTLTSYDGDVLPMGTTPVRGKYFTQAVIAQTVNDADPTMYWIACIPITVYDTNWRDVLRVTALQFTGNAKPAAAGHGIRVNGVDLPQRGNFNVIDGNGIDIAGADDAGNDESEITFVVNQGELSLANLGTRAFTNLSDVPSSYASQALKGLRVNAAEDAIEFHDFSGDFVLKTGDTMTGPLDIGTDTLFPFISTTTYTALVADAATRYGVFGSATANQNGFNLTGTVGVTGVYGRAIVSGASGTVTGATGLYGYVEKSGNGNLGSAYGAFIAPATKTGSGSLSSVYGLYLSSQTVGSNNYGVYQAGTGINVFTDVIGSGVAAPDSQLHLAAGALSASKTYLINGSATVNSTQSTGLNFVITGHSAGVGNQTGAFFNLSGGNSGIDRAAAILASTTTLAGSGSQFFNPGRAANALFGTATGAGQTNIGASGSVANAGTNVGVVGQAQGGTPSVRNFGVAGLALRGTSLNVGGYFAISDVAVSPSLTSAALIANNGSTTSNILDLLDNDVSVVRVVDGGNVLIGTTSDSAKLHVSQSAGTGTQKPLVLLTSAAHTALTAAERNEVSWNFSATQQYSTGSTVASQRVIRIQPPTYTATSATQTFTEAITLDIGGAPTASTNVTITTPLAFNINSGKSRFKGNVILSDVNVEVGSATGTQWGDSSSKQGWFGATPVAQSTGWAGTNHTPTKTLDASTAGLTEVINAVCTLIEQYKTYGQLGA